MFEKFGFRDVLYNIKKYLLFILTIGMLMSIISIGGAVVTSTKSDDDVVDEFTTTMSFYVVPDFQNDIILSSSEQIEATKSLVSSYVEILKSDVCNEYLINYISKNFDQYDSKKFNKETIEESIKITYPSGTLLVNIEAETSNKDLGNIIIDAYQSFIEANILQQSQNFSVQINYIGTSQSSVLEDSTESSTYISSIKIIIVQVFCAVIIAIILVCLKTLFLPTLNRKSDFRFYDVPVFCEVKIKRKRGLFEFFK